MTRAPARAPRVYAPDAAREHSVVQLPEDEAHHLTRVLRLTAGARVSVFNGTGDEWDGRIDAVDRAKVIVRLDRRATPLMEPAVKMTLAVALLKGDQMDDVIRDATALGVHAIVPVASAHVTVPARAWQSGGPIDRWRRLAVAAAKQSGRAVVPDVRPIVRFDEAVDAQAHGLVVLALEPAADGLPELEVTAPPRSALALVGPEGGWSDEEIAHAAARGARALRLGPRRLRAELAPAVLLTALWTRWGW